MRPLALAVEQFDAALDTGPALAAVPASRRFVLRPPALASLPAPLTAEVLTATWRDRLDAAALVHRQVPSAVVVVLRSDERVSAGLGRALIELCRDDDPGAYRARRVQHFLGREVADETLVIAWRGDPRGAPPRDLLEGDLLKVGRDIAGTIADLDVETTRVSQGRLFSGGDFSIAPARALLRRLWLRRKDGVPGLVLSVLETYGEVLTAAKGRERLGCASGQRTSLPRRHLPEGFTSVETRTGSLFVRNGIDERLVRVLLEATPDNVDGEPLLGAGRGAAWAVTVGEHRPRAVLRWYRRGGALRHVLRDRYFGWRLRPVAELVLTEQARRRGVAAAEVLAARVDRLGGGFYRGALVTREIERAETLAGVLRRRPSGSERGLVVAAVARTLRVMHDCGVQHRDLNASNILLRCRDGSVDVCLIDFDRAALRPLVRVRARRRALRRLARSVAKLDRERALVTADDCTAFHRAYWREP